MTLPKGTVSDPVTVPAGISLVGPLKDQVIDSSTDLSNATVFSAPVTFQGDVSINGVVLNAIPIMNNADVIDIQSSVIGGISSLNTTSLAPDHLERAVIGIG